jgi:TRAP-type uncharacterized transport system fused permease subunit
VNTPDQEAVALNAHVTRELFTAFKSKFDMAVLPVIACVLLAIVVGVVAYMGSERLTELYEKVIAIQDMIASGSGY